MFENVEQPGIGTYLTPGSPVDFKACERVRPTCAPAIGEHTDEILEELLGMSPAEVAALHDDRIVSGPR